jgi:membrane protein required for colicin V production
MSSVDIVLGALILFGFIRGFMKGLFVEMASLVALIAGVYGSIHFSHYASDFLMDYVDWSEQTVTITAFGITFIIIVIAVTIAGKALTKLANFAALGLFNKILGGVFGGLKIALILSAILLIFSRLDATVPFVSKQELENSILYGPVKSFVPMISPIILDNHKVIQADSSS